MELNPQTKKIWKSSIDLSLPGLLNALTKKQSPIFLIGASLFDIYQMEGWLKTFSRQTGDADFSIEYLGDPTDYQDICNELLAKKYTKDPLHPYRYHPPELNGIYAYVDLLTFTTNQNLESEARRAMAVGESFNFEGMDFAKHDPIHFDANIYFPNPISMIYLKMRSYYHNPERTKDFTDLIEMILRLVDSNVILDELKQTCSPIPFTHVQENLKRMCNLIEKDLGRPYDLEDIRSDLEQRKILDEFNFDSIPETVEFFRRTVLGK